MADRGKSVHEIANCCECKWESEARDAVTRARTHHHRTGHTVSAERGVAFRFETTTTEHSDE